MYSRSLVIFYLLDTHVILIALTLPDQLPAKLKRLLSRGPNLLTAVSSSTATIYRQAAIVRRRTCLSMIFNDFCRVRINS